MLLQPLRTPVLSSLTADQCRSVLDGSHVGRVAYQNGRLINVEPVHYACAGRWILMRSAEGAAIEAFAHNPYVTFEVDEVDALFDWRSVVAHGAIVRLDDAGAQVDHQMFIHALEALRSFMPDTQAFDDPTALRQTTYGLYIDQLKGRRAEQRKRPRARRAGALKPIPQTRPFLVGYV
ncbi:MAG: pyridoxamine 5'-phosphate oxidase family protein [bacterium]